MEYGQNLNRSSRVMKSKSCSHVGDRHNISSLGALGDKL